MMEKKLKDLLNQADFSRDTDLKQRLHEQLFGSPVVQFPTRFALEDDELEGLYAAGTGIREKTDTTDDPLKNGRN